VSGLSLSSASRPALVGRVSLRARPSTVLAGLVVAFILVAALAPQLLTHRSPTAIDLHHTLGVPSWSHPLGTDNAGRDQYTRVVFGARQSLGIGVGATALAMLIAVVLGFSAGLAGGWVDVVITRFLEVAFAFPALLLALLLISLRGQVLAVRQSGYVEAAGALGHRRATVVRRHLFPNAMRPLVAVLTLGVGQSIVWAAGLAFLGLGVAPPSSEWGALLDAGRLYITTSWWLEILPGLVIVLFALSMTSLGRTWQHRLEGASR
jgi:peptide/nickel transport system permease protein